MLRSSLSLACVAALCATAPAQQTLPGSRVQPITAPVRDAGVFHLGTGTWTRKASTVNIGADIIYNNTCNTGFYSSMTGDRFVDEGRVPAPDGPNNLQAKPGCTTSYTIDGFQIAYCTDQPTVGSTIVNFYESYAPCSTVVGVTPLAGFDVGAALPGGSGGLACWIVTLDLDSPPQTASLAFSMQADGDGTFTTTPNQFGWSLEFLGILEALQTATGPIIAGDPNTCQLFDGTRWDTPINYLEAGTGMGSTDAFRVENGVTAPGCYWFGGPPNPYASFHMELYADACGPTSTGTPFCDSTGGTACPCVGSGQTTAANRGCGNSFNTNAGLTATGNAQVSNDTVVITCDQLPAASVLFFQGTLQQNGGAGTVFGDGKRCAGGTVIRLHTHTAQGTPGQATSSYPSSGPDHSGPPDDPISIKGAIPAGGATRTYQAWYRNSNVGFCPPAVFNLSNGLEIVWGA